MPLKIIVIGAGIAGLSAAISLRQSGHEVEIFEKSQFAAEIGAAFAVSPNAVRVLTKLGFSFDRVRAVKMSSWNTLHGDTMTPITTTDLSTAESKFGAACWTAHRVDVHNELLHLATRETLPGKPVQIHLDSEVISAATDGSVVLKDGTNHIADLTIAADGIHSALRAVVLEAEDTSPTASGLSTFRFLIDTVELEKDARLSEMLREKSLGSTILADTKETVKERHMVWYSCRGGDVQNFVGIHPTRNEDFKDDIACKSTEKIRSYEKLIITATKTAMLEEFSHFHPDVIKIISKSSHIKCWPLFIHEPLRTWFNGRLVLIGDAAHPMLPFSGQGANQAIEDGGALGYLLKDVENTNDISKRLVLFELVRKNRASRIQVLSKVRVGREMEVQEELRKYLDPLVPAPTTMQERVMHDYGFDVIGTCEAVLQAHKERFRE